MIDTTLCRNKQKSDLGRIQNELLERGFNSEILDFFSAA